MHVHKYCYLFVSVHVAAWVSVPANTSANPAHTHILLWICLYQTLHARHFQVSTFWILCWGGVSTYHIRGTHGYICVYNALNNHAHCYWFRKGLFTVHCSSAHLQIRHVLSQLVYIYIFPNLYMFETCSTSLSDKHYPIVICWNGRLAELASLDLL